MTDKTPGVRHAISRSTGATTWTRKDGEEWKTTCLDHGAEATATARRVAWKNGSTPANCCATCTSIVAGTLEKITGDRLPIPTTKTTTKKAAAKPAPTKPAAKPTATKAAK